MPEHARDAMVEAVGDVNPIRSLRDAFMLLELIRQSEAAEMAGGTTSQGEVFAAIRARILDPKAHRT